MYLLIIIFKKSEFMAAQRARPILLNERFLVIYMYVAVRHWACALRSPIIVRASFRKCTSFLNSEYNFQFYWRVINVQHDRNFDIRMKIYIYIYIYIANLNLHDKREAHSLCSLAN